MANGDYYRKTSGYSAEISESRVSMQVCPSMAQLFQLWLRGHFQRWGKRILKAKHQEVGYETVSHRNECLNNTGTMPILTEVLTQRGKSHGAPHLDKELQATNNM